MLTKRSVYVIILRIILSRILLPGGMYGSSRRSDDVHGARSDRRVSNNYHTYRVALRKERFPMARRAAHLGS
jgi:hypothetical protein